MKYAEVNVLLKSRYSRRGIDRKTLKVMERHGVIGREGGREGGRSE